MPKINILPAKVYNRIAAGEVVDRPYSVVKELVENSIDAGATEIEIYIEKGGKQLIRIVDNGCGIEREDLHSAFLPHATSKIAKAEDLENILTLGFRGEAVASIAAVSKMTITSKTKEGKCYSLHSDGGELGQIIEAAGENGTDVSVEMLFFNTPVRLGFLKTDKGEETDITNFVSRFILNRPEIAFNRIKDILAGNAYYFSDLIWYDPEFFCAEKNEMPLDFYFDSIETATMRSSWEKEAIYVGFHGGYNGETHAHLDVGSFVLDAEGERFIMDPGPDDYNLPGGVFNRYRYRAEGHNTLVVNPDAGFDQREEGRGVMTCFGSSPDECKAVCDMTDAYREKVNRLERTVALTEGRTKVVITDQVDAAEPVQLYWFAHTEAEIELLEDGRSAVLEINGKQLLAEILSDEQCGVKWTVMDPKPLPDTPIIAGQAQNEGIRKLAIYVPQFKGTLRVAFRVMKTQ